MLAPSQSSKKPVSSNSRLGGRYELQHKLGEGGMGVVWQGLDTKTGGQVAIKIMKDGSDPAAVELFAKEWRALAELCHPNIVDVRDVDVLQDHRERKPFFVMPLLRGATLAEFIADASTRLTVGRVVEIITQVCRGLQAAHQMGLIHRDLKPSNIFVMSDDTAKIIDFGVVYLSGSHSVTGQKGTFQYMSPEQVQMKEITPASDIFALGVILYEALTGRKPFACATAEETMRAVLKQIPPPVSEINGSIPQPIGRVVHKCLAKQPMHRFSSARDLAEALGKALRNEPIFDAAKLQPRIERAKIAFRAGDEAFASEVLAEMESEGHLDPEITVLRMQIEMAVKQKKIRQLLEGARARIEQDEIALGVDKLREVLELDPENADALSLREHAETQRSEAHIGKWLDLANTHLANRDFAAARHAVEEVRKTRNGDFRALDLLQQIDSVEAEAKRVREQKEQLYNTAMKSYQNGDIDSALNKLGRLFSVVRSRPEAAIPERDAVYESFYKEVRSEHDTIRSLLQEAQHQFSEKHFAQAIALCNGHLEKYPSDGVFRALKIQSEDAERQEVSAYIAAVTRNVEAEPDLDRRVNILREAAERHPGEAQFAQQLKVLRERRDLVNSIVAKARQFDERGHFAEALSQWDILGNIHPRFPGLAFELEQCRKKRDLLASEEEKARLVEEIVGLIDSRAYPRALDRVAIALKEFPGDTEIAGLEKLATEGLARHQDARQMFEQGQAAAATKDWTRATELLRDALRSDPRNPAMRDAVITVLTEQARSLAETDWPEAERLFREAQELDPNHHTVRALQSTIAETKRQSYVGEALTKARSLVAAGDAEGALVQVRGAREQYPRDPRLEQYENSLLKQEHERQRSDERGRSWAELTDARRRMEQNPDSDKVRKLLELSQTLLAQHPDDPDTERIVVEAEQAVRHVTQRDDLSSLLTAGTAIFGEPARQVRPAPLPLSRSGYLAPESEDTLRFQAASPVAARKVEASEKAARAAMPKRAKPPASPNSGRTLSSGALGLIAAGVAGVAGLGLFGALHQTHRAPVGPAYTANKATVPVPPVSLSEARAVRLTVQPEESVLTINGVASPSKEVPVPAGGGSVEVGVAHPGFRSKTLQFTAASDPHISLEAEPVHVTVQTADGGGTVELDGRRVSTADAIDGFEVPSDGKAHTLKMAQPGGDAATLAFEVSAGSLPRLISLHAKDLLVLAGLGLNATVYGGDTIKMVQVGGRRLNISNSGTALPPLTEASTSLRYGIGDDSGSLALESASVPTLMVRSLTAESQMLVASSTPKATLTMNNVPQKPGRHGWQMIAKPGDYTFTLAAEGFEPQTWTTTLHKHERLNKSLVLAAHAVAPTTSTLLIAGSTPRAQIDLDGRRLGELDANGGAQFRGIAAGRHTVSVSKAGLCGGLSREVEVRPPGEAHLNDLRLDACGTVTVRANTRAAIVRTRQAGASEWVTRPINLAFSTPPGTYDLTVETEGLPAVTQQFKVEAAQNTDVPVKFAILGACRLQDPAQAAIEGDWLKPRNPGSLLYLRQGCTNVQLSFNKAGFLGKRHVQWVIASVDGGGRVEYELEEGKLSRKVVVGRDVSDVKEAGAAVGLDAKGAINVHINTEGSRIHITNDKGQTLDDYTGTAPALREVADGRVGLRTNVPFTVKGRD